ncbi:unnamed protein product [Ambrosiozyma monospora]|uniref:Unnamed protein product n=1 Tax=Ambrosiozyma monospora TaxID=43982 RepID=A0A9W6YTH9_AMBMO|nr:unnamed protein product [Ambrosiozyma monospora]
MDPISRFEGAREVKEDSRIQKSRTVAAWPCPSHNQKTTISPNSSMVFTIYPEICCKLLFSCGRLPSISQATVVQIPLHSNIATTFMSKLFNEYIKKQNHVCFLTSESSFSD